MTAITGPCRMKPNRCHKSLSCPDPSSVTRNIKCASSSDFFNRSIKYARIKPRAKYFPLSKSRLRRGVSRQRPGEPPETSHSQDTWCKTTEPESSFSGRACGAAMGSRFRWTARHLRTQEFAMKAMVLGEISSRRARVYAGSTGTRARLLFSIRDIGHQ